MFLAEFNNKCSGVFDRINVFFKNRMRFLYKDDTIRIFFLLFFLFCINLFAGLFFINDGIFHYDAIVLANAVEKTYETGELHGQVNGRYGSVILNSAVYFPFYISGYGIDFPTRFASLFYHSLAIVFLFLFLYEFLDDRALAFFASLLFSFVPVFFSPNTYGKEHGAALFILLLSFYLLIKGIKKNSWPVLGLSSIFFVFSISVRESMIVFIPLYLLLYIKPVISISPFIVVIRRDTFSKKNLATVFLLFLGGFLLLLKAGFFMVLFRTLSVQGTDVVSFLGLFSPILSRAIHDIWISLPKGLLMFFLIGTVAATAVSIKSGDLFSAIFLALWLLLLFYFGNTNGYAARHLDAVLVPLVVFSAYPLVWLYRKNKFIGILTLLYFMSSMLIFMYPVLSFRHSYNGEKEFALFVRNSTEEDSLIITMDDSPFIQFYGRRKTLGHPIGDQQKTDEWINELKTKLKNGVPVYLSESGLSYDFGQIVQKAVLENFHLSFVGSKLTEDYHHNEIRLGKYEQKLFKLGIKEEGD